MRKFIRTSLEQILKTLAMLTLKKYRPGIIGVTGSVGKTSTKNAIALVLGSLKTVRVNPGNFNNEIGLPLTILGEWNQISGFFFWPKVIFFSVLRLIIKTTYPEYLVLEYAADKPGDIKYLLSIAKVNIGVITAIGDMPVHVEFYPNPEAVAREKARLIETLPTSGFAVLNTDESRVIEMRERTRAHTISFGFNPNADMRITNYEIKTEAKKPIGISFKLEYGGSFIPVRMSGVFGRQIAYAAAAGAAVGVSFGMHLVRIAESLVMYTAAEHRMNLIPGIKNTYIFDDAYNASPLSMEAAFETVKSLPAKRRVSILGDMLEIGEYAPEAHETLGKKAAKIFDVVVTVGPRAKLLSSAARNSGMHPKNIHSFDTAEEAEFKIQDFVKEGDLILVKGSRAMRLEKLVEALRAA